MKSMDNYSMPLRKCVCGYCGNTFYCISATWWCKDCYEKMQKTRRKFDMRKEDEGENEKDT